MSEDNPRPPLPSINNQRRSSSKKSWRQNDNDNNNNKTLQKGIDPSSFHHSPKNKHARAPKVVRQALKEASTNVVKQKQREVTTSLKLQRAAFKQVTSLKTWPLQDMGIKDYNHCMTIHYGVDEEADTTQEHDGDFVAETHGDSTGLSSSSLDEPKRIRRQQQKSDDNNDLSPRKSTMRHQIQQEFINERALIKGDVTLDDFSQALWCMEPRMFAVEKSKTGKRKYMVGALGRFLDYYWRKCDPKHRHYYELIREKTPCRLYFGTYHCRMRKWYV